MADPEPGGLLAFDFARVTGWCYAPPAYRSPAFAQPDPMYRLLVSGTETFEKAGAQPGTIFLTCHKWLGRMLQQYRPAVLAYERPFVPVENFSGAGIGMGFQALIQMHAYYHGDIPLIQIAPVSVKKHWTGSGRSKKPEMMDFTRQRGLDPKSHDEADAIAVCDFAVSEQQAERLWPPRRSAA